MEGITCLLGGGGAARGSPGPSKCPTIENTSRRGSIVLGSLEVQVGPCVL